MDKIMEEIMKTRFWIIPLLLLLCLLMAAKKEKYGSIYGSILEDGKNTFIANITVQCLQKNAVIGNVVSDEQGFYRLDKLKPGTYTLKINNPNYAVYENQKVRVKANKPTLLNIVLVSKPQKLVPEKVSETGKLSISVTDNNNVPLQYVNVSIYENNKRLTGSQTDAQGNAIILNIPAGTYSLICSLVGYEQVEKSNITIEAGKILTIPITMQETGIKMETICISAASDMAIMDETSVESQMLV